MTLDDLCHRPTPYTQEEFMEGFIGTCSDEEMKYWRIVVVMPLGEEIVFLDHERAISFLFAKTALFNYHVGNFAFAPTAKSLYIALFKNGK